MSLEWAIVTAVVRSTKAHRLGISLIPPLAASVLLLMSLHDLSILLLLLQQNFDTETELVN
jgi:hypothetical protein